MTTGHLYRLPATVRPIRYELTFAPNLSDFTFHGEETVELEVGGPTDRIVLNALDLTISDARLTLPDGSTATPQVKMDNDAETATFTFARTISPGKASLRMRFTGTLNDQLRGFYRSQYEDADGQKRYLATTQFEATDARRAFPCWDDPAVKATFQVTLVVPAELAAISNMPVESEKPAGNGAKAVRFAQSPKMSTYLLALVVGDMAKVEARAKDGTLIRVWTTRGKEEQGRYALENACKLLEYFNEYFGVRYPLPKLDHIAVPDFGAGAMENWGAITYRETALLYDPARSAAATRQRILGVVAHEMAHMWFGDLVTMEWWDDLWLNESFASWMGDKAVDHLYPDWQMWTQFVSLDTNAGLSMDGLRTSHPIEMRVEDPAQIRELFDAVSYSKGAAVLRMLEHFLGESAFRDGLRKYIARHQYANARTEDLWAALAEASGKPVTAVMGSWIKQIGYPVLQVKTMRSRSGLRLSLSQRRFLYDQRGDQETEDAATWQVPVGAIRAGSARKASLLLTERTGELSMGKATVAPRQDWVKLNPQQTGFYRVSYESKEWARLRSAVRNLEISPADRLGLQGDAYALMRAGLASATTFLSLAAAYRNEVDASVWRDVATNLRGFEGLLFDEPYLDSFQDFGRGLFRPIVRNVGWDPKPGEGHLDSLRRSIVLGQSVSYGDPGALREGKRRFKRFLSDSFSLHPDIRSVVYDAMAYQGDEETYDRMWELERKADSQEEKMRFLGALSKFRQPELLQETLQRSLSPAIRAQDTPIVMSAASTTKHGRDLTWQFLKENWAEFDRRYGDGGFAIMRVVATTGSFTTLQKAQEVEEFFRTHPAPSAARTIQQSLERIRLNARWLERNHQELQEWFAGKA
ncbi:MAG: M1 family peptidase [Dehalococcoidia bacterium]|nr:M1 family peptidase [Dehalococcoidia bacterium]